MEQVPSHELSELGATLRRIEELLATVVKAGLAPVLESELADKGQRFLYEHVGKLTGQELAKKSGLSTSTVSRTLQKWEQLGLLVKEGKGYRRIV
jgi:Fic family protein